MIPRPEFGGMKLSDPRLGRLLDLQIAENARVDAALAALEIVKAGPQRCCAEHGVIEQGVGTCPICARVWDVRS